MVIQSILKNSNDKNIIKSGRAFQKSVKFFNNKKQHWKSYFVIQIYCRSNTVHTDNKFAAKYLLCVGMLYLTHNLEESKYSHRYT